MPLQVVLPNAFPVSLNVCHWKAVMLLLFVSALCQLLAVSAQLNTMRVYCRSAADDPRSAAGDRSCSTRPLPRCASHACARGHMADVKLQLVSGLGERRACLPTPCVPAWQQRRFVRPP